MATKKILFTSFQLALCLAASLSLAQELAQVKELSEVEITEARLSKYAIGTRTSRIDSTVMAMSQTASLATLLNDNTSSHIKAYGNGMLASISFRGTGPEHTAVLWHGVNIAYPMLGQTDFSLLPLALNNKLLIQHGTGSSLYGSGALGGTIAISSRRPVLGTSISFDQWFGSFGTLGNNLRVSYATEKFYLKLMTSWNRSENDFTFRNTTKLGAPLESQQNAAFNQLGIDFESGLVLGEFSELEVAGQYVEMERQVQPSMNAGPADDFQDDNNMRLRARYTYNNGVLNGYLQYAYLNDFINYNGSITRSGQHVLRTSLEQQFGNGWQWSVAADHSLVGVEGEFYSGQRANESRTNFWGSFLAIPAPWLTLSANLRQGFHPVYRIPLSPLGGSRVFLAGNSDGSPKNLPHGSPRLPHPDHK